MEKNQCFSFGCKQPVFFVEIKSGTCLLLDKFTEVGLRQHLLQNSGVGLLMNEQMEGTLHHIHSEIECGTLCRLFDGDSLYVNTGSSNSRQEIELPSLAIHGFMQVSSEPLQFISKPPLLIRFRGAQNWAQLKEKHSTLILISTKFPLHFGAVCCSGPCMVTEVIVFL